VSRIELRLSGNERVKLFHAANHVAYNQLPYSTEAERLAKMVDGRPGWNPCELHLPWPNKQQTDVSFYVSYIITTALNRLDGEWCDLRGLQERIHYIKNRRDQPPTKHGYWPFATSGRNYGPLWDNARTRALERDNHRCTSCGLSEQTHYTEYGCGLSVHHIKPYSSFDDDTEAHKLDNLRSLCNRCHAEIDPKIGQ